MSGEGKKEPAHSDVGSGRISRRDLALGLGAAATASFAAAGWAWVFHRPAGPPSYKRSKAKVLPSFAVPPSKTRPELVTVRGAHPGRNVRAAVDRLGGMGAFISKGDRVLLKPNVGWDRLPEQAADTNPEVVAELVRLCLAAGAREVLVTDVPVNDPARCFERSGIGPAVSKAGARVVLPGPGSFTNVRVLARLPSNAKPTASILTEWPVLSLLTKVDKVINVPVAKHHTASRVTLGMKNWYGTLGGTRNQLHQKLHASIADLATMIRPTLVVMDATRVLMTNGPTGGSLDDVVEKQTVIAGVDQVAVDALACGLVGASPNQIAHIRLADDRKLGRMDLGQVRHTQIKI